MQPSFLQGEEALKTPNTPHFFKNSLTLEDGKADLTIFLSTH
jgi:hypothetical protein